MARTWSAVLARLDVPTGDGRVIAGTGGSSRDLPLPLLYQGSTSDGHDGSVVVGRIESLRIADGMVTATGSMLPDQGYQAEQMIVAGVIGPSVDLDDIEYVMDDAGSMVITQWRIAGATLVAIPAFAGVSITLDPEPVEPLDEVARPMTAEEGDAMWASASARPEPVLPPAEWFERPDVDRLTPVTVSDTGRVFGHIAGWDQCHVGLPGCVTPPTSPSGYSYFHVGAQRVQGGAVLPVGTLTVGGGHADAQIGFRAAQQHYDDVATGVARVMAYDDEFGIAVAGWIIPDADPVAREQFMSLPVSGDWRRIGGTLEMIAVCSVNTPGFPVPRARVSFSLGSQRTLIASGMQPVAGHVHKLGNPDEDGGVMDDWDNCRDPECPGPDGELVATYAADSARAKWAWTIKGDK